MSTNFGLWTWHFSVWDVLPYLMTKTQHFVLIFYRAGSNRLVSSQRVFLKIARWFGEGLEANLAAISSEAAMSYAAEGEVFVHETAGPRR